MGSGPSQSCREGEEENIGIGQGPQEREERMRMMRDKVKLVEIGRLLFEYFRLSLTSGAITLNEGERLVYTAKNWTNDK